MEVIAFPYGAESCAKITPALRVGAMVRRALNLDLAQNPSVVD
jgi:hypothetical protein